MTGPMPHSARTGRGWRKSSSSSARTSTTPGPGSMPEREAVGFAALDASLAISLDRPTPTEQSRCISSRTRARISRPMLVPEPNRWTAPLTSRNASSSEIPSTSGVNEPRMACSRPLSST